MRFNGISPSELSPKIFVPHEVIDSVPAWDLNLVNGQRQSYLNGIQIRERDIHLFLNFAGKNKENANELARMVAGLFCVEEPGEYEPDQAKNLALTAILSGASAMEWHWGFGVIEYTFKAPRPYYHSIAETILTGTSIIRMEPRGTVACRPVITHTMAAAAAALEIKKDNVTFMRIRNPLGSNLTSGLKIEVDFVNRLVTVNNEAAMAFVDYTKSDWHPDIIKPATISLTDSGSTTVRWRDEWL